ncbi:uncharacterized protein Bfra_008957 [Botrytis fragariae]|uniref:Uncharacterized protein n=1 Tax=Botrytis fragariae TaxID=1964551 RepID=A0A8H6AQF5_9HELO|nr:uncharacterized protein Bfra_008957 [Botrytis fragariae]KAF5871931.1 hypothetical protein Bfra_008957 [Botrytis fragariae]
MCFSGDKRWSRKIKTIDILNTFDLDNLHFLMSVNKPDNFQQMKLAAACFGLNFDNWTMETAIFWRQTKGSQRGSPEFNCS